MEILLEYVNLLLCYVEAVGAGRVLASVGHLYTTSLICQIPLLFRRVGGWLVGGIGTKAKPKFLLRALQTFH